MFCRLTIISVLRVQVQLTLRNRGLGVCHAIAPGCAATIFSYFLLSVSISRVLRSISSARRLISSSNLAMAASFK